VRKKCKEEEVREERREEEKREERKAYLLTSFEIQ
jgi:hypothetical protein